MEPTCHVHADVIVDPSETHVPDRTPASRRCVDIPDTLDEDIRFMRGLLLGTALSNPIWALYLNLIL